MRAPSLLFAPGRIGSLEIRNRIVMSPMTTGYATADGRPSDRLIAFLEARAHGGVGLITLEACTIDRRHREVPRSMHFSDDSVIEPHRELVQRMHAQGAAVQPQIVHPGPDGLAPFLEKIPSLGPSIVASYLTGVPSRALEAGEIPDIVTQYADAARRVRAAGYDGLELHAAHGYMLLGSFLSPWRNKRQDEYTGQTSAGRIKLIVEVVRAIKQAAGQDFPITLRISGYERVSGGRDIADTQRIAPVLAAAGVDAFHVSGGVIDRLTSQIVTGAHYPDAHNAAAAAAVRSAVDVPVMVVGRIHTPELAERVLVRGQADFVVMGRPLLADPELPNKALARAAPTNQAQARVRDGRLRLRLRDRSARADPIRRCISCQNCIDSMEVGRMECAVNAFAGRELELPCEPAREPRHVLVVGSGPGGLESARIAAMRGPRVTLMEQERYLGGALVLAAAVHPENEPLLTWLIDRVRRSPVDLKLGERADTDAVRRLGCDAVIVATGGRLATPSVTGDHLPHVVSAADLRRLASGALPHGAWPGLPGWQRLALAGIRVLSPALQPFVTSHRIRKVAQLIMPFGECVAIVGGDLAAVELAEFIAQSGRRVHVLEAAEQIAPEVGLKRRTEHMDRLDRLGVAVHTGVEVRSIEVGGVEIAPSLPVEGHASSPSHASGACRRVAADHVILAGATRPDTSLADALRASLGDTVDVHTVGDCTGLGLIRKAIVEAAQVATAL